VLNYFASLDIPVMELFGQSESTGPHTSNFTFAWKVGTIGRDVRTHHNHHRHQGTLPCNTDDREGAWAGEEIEGKRSLVR
jgi:hypothetical protein